MAREPTDIAFQSRAGWRWVDNGFQGKWKTCSKWDVGRQRWSTKCSSCLCSFCHSSSLDLLSTFSKWNYLGKNRWRMVSGPFSQGVLNWMEETILNHMECPETKARWEQSRGRECQSWGQSMWALRGRWAHGEPWDDFNRPLGCGVEIRGSPEAFSPHPSTSLEWWTSLTFFQWILGLYKN